MIYNHYNNKTNSSRLHKKQILIKIIIKQSFRSLSSYLQVIKGSIEKSAFSQAKCKFFKLRNSFQLKLIAQQFYFQQASSCLALSAFNISARDCQTKLFCRSQLDKEFISSGFDLSTEGTSKTQTKQLKIFIKLRGIFSLSPNYSIKQ